MSRRNFRGRAHIASRYRSRRAWKAGLQVGGAAVGLGGLAFLMFGSSGRMEGIESADPAIDTTPVIVGTSIAAAGLLAATIGLSIDPHPISHAEAKLLADEYNQRLRRNLGLEAQLRIQPGIAAFASGGGLTLSGTF